MLFSTVWLRKKNRRDRKQGRKFSLPSPLFLSSQIGRKMRREKCCEMHFTQILSHFIHDLMTFASSHSYHFTFSQHSNVFFFFFFYLPCLISKTKFLWAECSVNLLTMFLLVTKSFAQLNLYVHYCNFYIIIKIIIKIYIYDVVNFILFNEYK